MNHPIGHIARTDEIRVKVDFVDARATTSVAGRGVVESIAGMGEVDRPSRIEVRRRDAEYPRRFSDGEMAASWTPRDGDLITGIEDRVGQVEDVALYVNRVWPVFRSRRIVKYVLQLEPENTRYV